MCTNLSGYCCCGCLVTKLCLTLCDPVDCNLQGSSVHGILQTRILQWVAISFSGGSSQPKYRTQVYSLASRFFSTEPPGKPPVEVSYSFIHVFRPKSCPTLCDLMGCSTRGFPVRHCFPEFAQIHVHWIRNAIQPSHPLSPPSPSCPQSFPASGSFPMSQLFTSGGQIIGSSASVSVLPMNIQGWFPLVLTGLISLLAKGLSRVFSITTVQKHQFFGAQTSLWSSSHIHTWLWKKT